MPRIAGRWYGSPASAEGSQDRAILSQNWEGSFRRGRPIFFGDFDFGFDFRLTDAPANLSLVTVAVMTGPASE